MGGVVPVAVFSVATQNNCSSGAKASVFSWTLATSIFTLEFTTHTDGFARPTKATDLRLGLRIGSLTES